MPIERLKEVENILRTRYMKCLTFKTPEEVWNIEIEKTKTHIEKKLTRATLTALPASIIQTNRCSA